MDRKRIAAAVLALGILVFALSALADEVGVGEGSGIGWKQVVGMAAGVAAVAVGGLWWRSGPGTPDPGSPEE